MVFTKRPHTRPRFSRGAQTVLNRRFSPFAWLLVLVCLAGRTLGGEVLPGTQPLDWTDDLSVRIVEEAHRWLDHKLDESIAARERLWKRDFSSEEAYEKSIEPNRQHFRKCIGVVDSRMPVSMERYGDDSNPALVSQTERYCVFQVRWPVLDGVCGEGLLLEPKQKPAAYVVVIPDADQTPEQSVGLAEGVEPADQYARRLAENGCQIVVPALVDRACDYSGNPQIRMTNQPHREWIYRQAYEMGRHVIGYEVQKVLSAVDWFEQIGGPDARIAVAGYAEGGLIALHSAAVDKRIGACLVSGYFDCRQRLWEEPIYRNVWNLLREFGDAELASLISPRTLVVEHSVVPQLDGPPQIDGRGGAAPGKLWTPDIESVRAELARTATLDKAGLGSRHLIAGATGQPVGPGSPEALAALMDTSGRRCEMSLSAVVPLDRRKAFRPQSRQQRQVEELVAHVQLLQRRSDAVRDDWFLDKTDRSSPETFAADARKYREVFRDEVIGWFDDPLLPSAPRTRQIYNEAKWVGYEVVLDVWPGLHAWCVVCLPKDIQPGEKRPVVVCQHGLEGVPRDTIEKSVPGSRYYHAFAAELAERGFITVAPFNLYRGQESFRLLRRKAAPLRASLFSIIAPQHQQILNWLASLPYVDKSRIGFYGLSYGGVSALRLPALLEGYSLSICSANFNDWIRKNVSIEFPASYMFTDEWEMSDFDLGHTFNYAEMAYLIFPRPFMVERGHHDGVAPGSWVEYEYAKIRYLYDTLGLGDRTEIEFFNGGHEIHGVGTFEFLNKHLNWPAPAISKQE